MATPVEAARPTQEVEAKVVVSPAQAAEVVLVLEEAAAEEEAEATSEASIMRATIWMLKAVTLTR